jgi:hypothetical protein
VSRGARRLGEAVRELAESAQRDGPEHGIVREVDPLAIELTDSELLLEDEDIVLGKLVRQKTLEVGDTVVGEFVGDDDEFLVMEILGGGPGQQSITGWSNIAVGAVGTKTVSVPGAAVGDAVQLGPPANLAAGLIPVGIVTAAGQVQVRILNGTTGGAETPADGSWTIITTPP